MVHLKTIPCPHEKGASISEKLPDYHPINEAEIAELLNEALRLEAILNKPGIKNNAHLLVGRIAGIQVRLNQGIKGMTCPRPYCEEDIARRMFLVDQQYMLLLDREISIAQAALRMHQLMTEKKS